MLNYLTPFLEFNVAFPIGVQNNKGKRKCGDNEKITFKKFSIKYYVFPRWKVFQIQKFWRGSSKEK